MDDVASRLKRHRLERYRKPEPKGRKALIRIALAALSVWLAYQVVASEHGLIKMGQTKSELRRLDTETALLLKEKAKLSETAKLYQNNPFLLEKALRDELGMVRKGELVYRFNDVQEDAPNRLDNATN
ncbi:MAG: septum formation initiator family protein [Candidatus Eisenbacteria bacterium]|nr:septum formation initiator family protein [Candidatus Eisenbacteria bacterium]